MLILSSTCNPEVCIHEYYSDFFQTSIHKKNYARSYKRNFRYIKLNYRAHL